MLPSTKKQKVFNGTRVTHVRVSVIQGQLGRNIAQGLVRTDDSTVHRTAVGVFLLIVVNGMVSETQRCGRVVCLSTKKTARK